jgi:hypothetical protein
MKVSELIKELEKQLEEVGDVLVDIELETYDDLYYTDDFKVEAVKSPDITVTFKNNNFIY